MGAPHHGPDGNLVLIGFAEALSAPEVAWSLVDAGFRVVAFSRKGRKAALRHSRHVTVHEITAPENNSETALADISRLLSASSTNSSKPSLLFPLDDAAVWLCGRKPLPAGWRLVGPNEDCLPLALDKSVQMDAAKQASLRVPTTTLATTSAEVLARVDCCPLILKPRHAVLVKENRLGKGTNWICANRVELEKALIQWREQYPLLIQPFIAGRGEGIFGLATPRGVEILSAHRRLRMMNPHGSGSSACVSQSVPENLKAPIARLIADTGWQGLFMIELLRDHAGQYWFVEFNGRPWGSMALSRRQGLEYPSWAAKCALNSEFFPAEPRANERSVVCRNVGRELMHLLFVLRGKKSEALQEWPSFWRALFDVMFIRPRDSFYNFRRDDLKVFLSDSLGTLRDQMFKSPKQKKEA